MQALVAQLDMGEASVFLGIMKEALAGGGGILSKSAHIGISGLRNELT